MRLPYNECENEDMEIENDEKMRCKTRRISRLSLPEPCVSGVSHKEGYGSWKGWTCFKLIIASICTVLLPMGIVFYVSLEKQKEKNIMRNDDWRKLGKIIESKISKEFGHMMKIESGRVDMKMKVSCGEKRIGTCEEIVKIEEINDIKIGKDKLDRCFVKNIVTEKIWMIGQCTEMELKLRKGMSVNDERLGKIRVGYGSGRRLERWIGMELL